MLLLLLLLLRLRDVQLGVPLLRRMTGGMAPAALARSMLLVPPAPIRPLLPRM